eukprot:jgi/Mesvir1/16173/Mv08438-RA.1
MAGTSAHERVRLYSRGSVVSFSRGKSRQYPSRSLILIENVTDFKDTQFYLGKKVAYVYKAKTEKKGTKYRCIWGRITQAHGNSGVVRAKFRKNLPPCALGGRVRVMLYPSST